MSHETTRRRTNRHAAAQTTANAATIDIAPYRLALGRPLSVGCRPLLCREGWVLRLRDAGGCRGFGEVAPLPGLHVEDLDEARRSLVRFLRRTSWQALDAVIEAARTGGESTRPASDRAAPAAATGRANTTSPPPPARRLLEAVAELPAGEQLTPSARFGLECAVLTLAATARRCSLAALYHPSPADRLRLTALVDGNRRETEAVARQCQLHRFAAVKVKVGRRPVDEEVASLLALRRTLGRGIEIRLDANRAFDLDSAVHFARRLNELEIAWIEEPLADPSAIPAFTAASGLPVALDETLREAHGQALRTAPAVRAWIIKPGRIGLLATCRLIDAAPPGVQPIISSSFESGLGLTTLAHLAVAAAGREAQDVPAAGLATDAWLAADLVAPRFDSSAGNVLIDARPIAPGPEFQRRAEWQRLPDDARR